MNSTIEHLNFHQPSRPEALVTHPHASTAAVRVLRRLLRQLTSRVYAIIDEICAHRPARRELTPRDVSRHLLRDIGFD